MVLTIVASWYIASTREDRRAIAFWLFLASNAVWLVWGLHDHVYSIVLVQICLAAMNIRGARKIAVEEGKSGATDR